MAGNKESEASEGKGLVDQSFKGSVRQFLFTAGGVNECVEFLALADILGYEIII